MAYKPEKIDPHAHHVLCPKSLARSRRTAKKAATRLVRRAAKRDPENAPARIYRGWVV